MYNFTDMPTETLVDLLSQETAKLTHLMAGKEFTEEYESSKNNIKQIQAILESRNVTTISDPTISFSKPDSTV